MRGGETRDWRKREKKEVYADTQLWHICELLMHNANNKENKSLV